MSKRGIPGGALAVTRKGRLALARGYSDPESDDEPAVEPTSLFRIASVSKPITAIAILQLVQDGMLKTSTPIVELLDFTPANGGGRDPGLDRITVAHLLQHLGGWDRNKAFDPMFRDRRIARELGVSLPITKYDIKTYMSVRPLQHAPGAAYSYSNYGYSLLGQIIEAVAKTACEEQVRKRVFAPLKITRPVLGRTLRQHRMPAEVAYFSRGKGPSVFEWNSARVPSPYGAWNLENMDAHGGWLASAVDLVRFASAFDRPSECPLLSEEMIETAFDLPENIKREDYELGDAYYGCGWSVRDWGGGNRNTWHGGSLPGTRALLVRRWRGNLNWCVLFNQRDDPSGLSYDDIDGLLHQTADSIEQWPDYDLFAEYDL